MTLDVMFKNVFKAKVILKHADRKLTTIDETNSDKKEIWSLPEEKNKYHITPIKGTDKPVIGIMILLLEQGNNSSLLHLGIEACITHGKLLFQQCQHIVIIGLLSSISYYTEIYMEKSTSDNGIVIFLTEK